jgi:hypothetical protein
MVMVMVLVVVCCVAPNRSNDFIAGKINHQARFMPISLSLSFVTESVMRCNAVYWCRDLAVPTNTLTVVPDGVVHFIIVILYKPRTTTTTQAMRNLYHHH